MNVKRLFALKEPCSQCPFRKDKEGMLNPGRLEDIIRALHNNIPFHCHKTVNYSKDTNDERTEDALYCGGSMVYLKKCENTNVPMRLGQMLGYFHPDELRGDDLVIEPLGLDRYDPRFPVHQFEDEEEK
ncbi:hypothetical protein [Paenibacillus sp. Y412MC10]|uniref:hypothetical protein n=1 Tax=Geobacillus sp. (strain Y412MC10) TaxID=481743 RepID=UPI0011AB64C9|nr:hypothetical protein [Paenibacillus sp. Y412MC10]